MPVDLEAILSRSPFYAGDAGKPQAAAFAVEAPRTSTSTLVWRPALYARIDMFYVACRVWRASAKARDLRALKQAKISLDPAVIESAAEDVAAVARALLGSLEGWTVTTVAPGHSRVSDNFAVLLSRGVAERMNAPWQRCFKDRFIRGSSHPAQFRYLKPLDWLEQPRTPVLLVDDLATTGFHLREATLKLREAGVPVLAMAWLEGGTAR